MHRIVVSAAAVLVVAAARGPVAHADPRHIDITVTERGFTPANVNVPAATPVALIFTRKTDKTCAKEVRLEVDGKRIERDLPLGKPVEIDVTFPKAGKLTYACGMDMVHGTITVESAPAAPPRPPT